jgi:hypothetical protein
MSKQPHYKPLNHTNCILSKPQTAKSRDTFDRVFSDRKEWYEKRDAQTTKEKV